MNKQINKNIVVIGGGFAGVAAIKELLKHRHEVAMTITLIDKNDYHLFTPSLYEVATSEEPQKNIAIPFYKIFGNNISCIKSSVTKIDSSNSLVTVDNQNILYDYLLLCAGSVPAYHHIPGLKENSFPLKSLADAMVIKKKIQSLCLLQKGTDKKVHIVIGGGGFSGTELAAELLMYKDSLAKQHNLARECFDITIIQGSNRLLKELDSHVSKLAQKRLSDTNIHFAFGGHIQEVTKEEIVTDTGKSYLYNILIWTGGVEANTLAIQSGLSVTKRNQVVVDNFLRVGSNIFAAGDIAGYIDTKTQSPVPTVAQVAEEQGKVAGENIYRALIHKRPTPYMYRHFGYIVPLKGKFAAAQLIGNIHIDGYIGWILQQLVFLRYLFTILPVWRALKKWNMFEINLKQ